LGSPIALQGEFRLEHHLRAFSRLGGKAQANRQWMVWMALLCAFAPVPLYATIREDGVFRWWGAALLAAILVLVITMFVLRLIGKLTPWQIKRAFKCGTLKPEQVSWTISDNGIHSVTADADSREGWAHYRACRIADDMILLYGHTGVFYLALPREFCPSEHDWERLARYIRAKLPEKKD
jgi:hypothetical protein